MMVDTSSKKSLFRSVALNLHTRKEKAMFLDMLASAFLSVPLDTTTATLTSSTMLSKIYQSPKWNHSMCPQSKAQINDGGYFLQKEFILIGSLGIALTKGEGNVS